MLKAGAAGASATRARVTTIPRDASLRRLGRHASGPDLLLLCRRGKDSPATDFLSLLPTILACAKGVHFEPGNNAACDLADNRLRDLGVNWGPKIASLQKLNEAARDCAMVALCRPLTQR